MLAHTATQCRWVTCAVGAVILIGGITASRASQKQLITSAEAAALAKAWIGDASADQIEPFGSSPSRTLYARDFLAWDITLLTHDGARHYLQVDATTGQVISWSRPLVGSLGSGMEPPPALQIEDARLVAEAFAGKVYSPFRNGRCIPALGSPAKGQMSYLWAWNEVVDSVSGALASGELLVEVWDQRGEAIWFYAPAQAPVLVSTRPTISRSRILPNARRFALLDPLRYPINHVSLRVQMDDYGSQRLVWECLQVLDVNVETGVLMYGVVFDAHTGEPLYPIAPIGGGKYPARSVRLPRHASVMLEPGRRALSTQLCPPVLGREGLWLRAEHLRAVDGVEVDVTREGVTVHHSGRT
ncbi:MAG: hypothetical protein GX446_10550, partial [Chthonomonadales bacterium]|nr:hypothetical protein [Chthonomonadales bacterium]